MPSWIRPQGPPGIHIPNPEDHSTWPESVHDRGYNPQQPWRLRKYDPHENGTGFDDDIVAQFKQQNVPRAILEAAATYDQLIRFADVQQTWFRGPPNRDGSNTNEALAPDVYGGRPIQTNGSPQLRHMWNCYAGILRAIHRDGQVKPATGGKWINEPWDELAEMMRTYPQQLERLEQERLGGHSNFNRVRPGFEWLYQFGAHLSEMTALLQAIITWAKDEGIDPKPYLPHAYESLPPIVKLLMTLKTREIQFEDRVGDEHFEDVLIDKRLWMVGPKAFCQFGTDWEVPARKWISMLRYTVKPQLAEFRKQLRDRFDYRLIVDWGYGRLWKKLYMPFAPKNQGEKDAIQQFSNFATTHSKLAFDLFAIYPLDLHEMEADPCSVCLCEYGREDIIVETHCNHHFHPACLFAYWDDEHHFQNRCPECRTSQGILREKVDFEAEREDKCYETDGGLRGLEMAQSGELRERVVAGLAFDDSKTLMDLFCRSMMERCLKQMRSHRKRTIPGWDDIK